MSTIKDQVRAIRQAAVSYRKEALQTTDSDVKAFLLEDAEILEEAIETLRKAQNMAQLLVAFKEMAE